MILLIPAFEHGRGGGHLCRCMTLACDLRALGREAWLYIPQHTGDMDKLFHSMNFDPAWRITDNDLQSICVSCNKDSRAKQVNFIILDRFQTPPEELSRWNEIGPVIGIDEGGSCRDGFDFLIDILIPEKFIKPLPNIADPSLLKFPPRTTAKRESPDGTKKILVSFGQEDSAGLGLAVTRTLCAGNFVAKGVNGGIDITWLRGGLAEKEKTEPLPNVRVIENIPNLAEHLGEYDIVITHYGITAYEALYAQTPVLLVSPTPYHEKLAKAAGFTTVSIKHLKKGVSHLFKNGVSRLLQKGESLTALINSFSPQVNRCCPVCAGNFVAKGVNGGIDITWLRGGLAEKDKTEPLPNVR
ncbi:MAG: hypothetical protein LBH44_02635, partial [Treponema sp.]|nr:hypothetical protein [Treponema sp.]